MKVDSIKELDAVLKLCRKHGVSQITIDNVTMTIDGVEEKESKNGANESKESDGALSEEDILFWSAGQVASNG